MVRSYDIEIQSIPEFKTDVITIVKKLGDAI